MSLDRVTPMEEPRLSVRRRAAPLFLRWRFLWSFGAALLASLTGVGVLLPTGNLLLPFQPTITLEGKMGSKGDFFEDAQVQRILMANHIRVHVTRTGPRDVALHDIEAYDFVFPSGQPAADLIINSRVKDGKFAKVYRPFTSPIVLATYREHAETLRLNGIATPRGTDTEKPLYYRLDMEKFLKHVEDRVSWNDLGIDKQTVNDQPVRNGNAVLAHSPNICSSNSSGTYMGLVAFVSNGNQVPKTKAEAAREAEKIKPLVTAQGLPGADLFRPYITPEGRGAAPIIVVYEHQFLAYQVEHSKVELGFRVLAPNSATESLPLADYRENNGVPVPTAGSEDTKAVLPELELFEEMIKLTRGCP